LVQKGLTIVEGDGGISTKTPTVLIIGPSGAVDNGKVVLALLRRIFQLVDNLLRVRQNAFGPMADIRTIGFGGVESHFSDRVAPGNVFHSWQLGASGKAESSMPTIGAHPELPSGHGGSPAIIDEVGKKRSDLYPALARIDIVLEHVAGDAQMMYGVKSRPLNFLELTGVETVLARLVTGKDGPALWASE
jgi:hypothetical protein